MLRILKAIGLALLACVGLFLLIRLLDYDRLNPPVKSDFVQDYFLARAVISGIDPYLPLNELGVRFGVPNEMSHSTPHPPSFAVLCLPFGLLSFQQAAFVWLIISLIALAVSLQLLFKFRRAGLPVFYLIAVTWPPILLDLTAQLILLTAIGLIILHPGVTNCDNRAMATYLSQRANNGDAVIFTSLTRLPIDYYLEQATIKKDLFETSFTSEIDKHPGYEGRITDPGRRAALESEGRELVDSLARTRPQDASRRIFFFHGAHPAIDSIVENALREQFELLPGEGVKCELSPYFKEVSVYR